MNKLKWNLKLFFRKQNFNYKYTRFKTTTQEKKRSNFNFYADFFAARMLTPFNYSKRKKFS